MKTGENKIEVLKDIEKTKMSKFYVVVIILTSIACVISITLYLIYNFINCKIYRQIISNEEENIIKLEYNFKYLLLWQKSLDYIKNSCKEVKIIKGGVGIVYNTASLRKINLLSNVYISEETIEYQELNGLSGYILDIQNNIENIKEVWFNNNVMKFDKSCTDIYVLDENNQLVMYKKNVKTSDGFSLEIKKGENNKIYTKYLFVYVPVTDIQIENTNIEMLRNSSTNLNIKVLPENSTVQEVNIEGNSTENIVISSDYVVTANIAGEYILKVKAVNEDINKEIKLIVHEIADKIEVDKNSISIYVGEKSKINAKVTPENAINSELEFSSSNNNVATVDEAGNVYSKSKGSCVIEIKTKKEPIVKTSVNIEIKEKVVPKVVQPNNNQNSSNNSSKSSSTSQTNNISGNGFTYIQGVLIVNKKYSIPSTYNPGVNSEAYSAYINLKNAAQNAGFSMPLISGFRSYDTQVGLYNRYVRTYGQATADTFSARPGHSEHQTGLAFDVGSIDNNYGNTSAGKWLANNCHKFGFIIRYPIGKQNITGYQYEPWHIRYLGNPLATNVYNSGLCLEEYFGI